MKTAKPRLTKAQIVKTLKKNDDLLKQHGVKRIGLFGSYARGKQTQSSDIDLIVEFAKPTYDNLYGLFVASALA